jgi:tetratricopeptide (TPR) repeat protein
MNRTPKAVMHLVSRGLKKLKESFGDTESRKACTSRRGLSWAMEGKMSTRDGPDDPDHGQSRDDILDEIVAGYLDRLNAGEMLDLDEVRREHPERAGEVIERLEVFRAVGAGRALEEDPRFIPAQFLLKSLDPAQGEDLEAGKGTTGPLGTERGGWRLRWKEAYEALDEEHWQEAAEAFGELYRTYERAGEPYVGAKVESWMGKALARLHADDYVGAIKDLSVAQNFWPDAVAPSLLFAAALHLGGMKEGAKEALEDLEAQKGPKERLALLVHLLYYVLCDYEESERWAGKIPDPALREAARADCLQQSGRNREAAAAAREAISADPKFLYGYHMLGLALLQQGELEGAEKVLLEAVDLDAQFVPVLAVLGGVLCRQPTKRKKGHDWLQRAVDIDPDYPWTYHIRGMAYVWEGDFQEAEAQFNEVLKRYKLPHTLVWKGYACMKQKRLEEARRLVDDALEIVPDFYIGRYTLGLIYLEQGKPEAGIREFREAIELAPGRVEAYSALARRLEPERFYDCREELEELIDLIQEKLPAAGEERCFLKAGECLVLARLHLPSDENLAKAADLALAVLERTRGKDPRLPILIAKSLFEKEQQTEAVRLLEKAYRVAREGGDGASCSALQEELDSYRQALVPARD